MTQFPKRLRGEAGNLVEYALLCLLIVLVCVVAIRALGGTVSGRFSQAGSGLN